MTPDPVPTLKQLLAFYLEAGVDCALSEEPVNRVADPNPAAALAQTTPAGPARTVALATPAARSGSVLPPEAAIATAREAARTAPSLDALRTLLE
ncbi:MAG: uracil-DNA glycosylase, partial [Bradyrhizobium sp.]